MIVFRSSTNQVLLIKLIPPDAIGQPWHILIIRLSLNSIYQLIFLVQNILQSALLFRI